MPPERKKDETAGTISPKSKNPTLEGEVSAQGEHTTSTGGVATEKGIDTTVIEAAPSVRDKQPAAAREAPEEAAKPSAVTKNENKMGAPAPTELPEDPEPQNKTADELMEEHVGEVPKAEKKFSLAGLKSKSEEAVPRSNSRPGTITVAKPKNDTFVRTSAKPEEWAAFDFIELETEGKLYLLTPDVVEEINALNEDRAQVMIKTMKKRLIYSVTRRGDPFLWPITIMDGNDWVDSDNTCADAAQESWIRVMSNTAAGKYDYVISPDSIEPKWPSTTYEEAVLKAFDGKIIDSMEHDVIRQLLGEG